MHLRSRAQSEECLVESDDEILAGAFEQRLDQGSTHRVLGVGTGPVAVEQRAQRNEEILALARCLAQEHGRAHRGRPGAFVAPEQGLERLAQLIRSVRARVEEGELPPVERLEKLVRRVREPRLQLDDERSTEDVEPGRLTGRNLRGRRRHRANAVGPEVEPLEDHGAGGDRARRREAKGADRPAELARGVGNATGLRVKLGLQLEDERPVDLAAPLPREEPARRR